MEARLRDSSNTDAAFNTFGSGLQGNDTRIPNIAPELAKNPLNLKTTH
jgi:hypothetical protein